MAGTRGHLPWQDTGTGVDRGGYRVRLLVYPQCHRSLIPVRNLYEDIQ